ncbi:MAG: hypothetical protein IIB17_11095 [Chloroflexi bacterium]|nr:hypothetical protein [Chloroflexota bacterium]
MEDYGEGLHHIGYIVDDREAETARLVETPPVIKKNEAKHDKKQVADVQNTSACGGHI